MVVQLLFRRIAITISIGLEETKERPLQLLPDVNHRVLSAFPCFFVPRVCTWKVRCTEGLRFLLLDMQGGFLRSTYVGKLSSDYLMIISRVLQCKKAAASIPNGCVYVYKLYPRRWISEPRNPSIGEFYVVREWRSLGFEALKLAGCSSKGQTFLYDMRIASNIVKF